MSEERLREHQDHLRLIDSQLADTRIETTKILAKQEALDANFGTLSSQFADFRAEIKLDRDELLQMLRDQIGQAATERNTRAVAETQQKEANRKWLQELLSPSTIAIILTIIGGAFGISMNQQAQTQQPASALGSPSAPPSAAPPAPTESDRP